MSKKQTFARCLTLLSDDEKAATLLWWHHYDLRQQRRNFTLLPPWKKKLPRSLPHDGRQSHPVSSITLLSGHKKAARTLMLLRPFTPNFHDITLSTHMSKSLSRWRLLYNYQDANLVRWWKSSRPGVGTLLGFSTTKKDLYFPPWTKKFPDLCYTMSVKAIILQRALLYCLTMSKEPDPSDSGAFAHRRLERVRKSGKIIISVVINQSTTQQ